MNETEIKQRFEQIYNSTYDYIYKYLICKADSQENAEDMLQSVYLAFYKRMLKGERVLDPKHYLLRAAKHRVADYYSGRKQTDSLDDGVEIVDEKALESLEKDDCYVYEDIMRGLREYDEVTYRIFQLRFGHDYTIGKTAKTLGLAESTVKSKMYRALKKLKNETREGERYALFGRS
ncbi:RNA polymerase sigma factor [uncultured Ruminococcus sp.]|uniref:RNA polymerase sigma factor n=1 Tax=uncultured Ruminococcus sp. TaxID=165186 RepID=UPI0025E2390C|nr:sigma-70 family RNA polymerase sigma factor [uncultured Ruminococcus sp.]